MSFFTLACAVCGTNPEQSNEAYLGMTMFMSLTPLLGLFGLGIFLVRRAIAADKRIESERHPKTESSPHG